MMAPKTDKETPEQKAAREQAEAEAKANQEGEKVESPSDYLARLKMEHEAITAGEEKRGVLTGDVAHARLARQRNIEQMERAVGKK